jgi:transposase
MQQMPGIEMLQLWKEVVAMGYKRSRSNFYHHLKNYVSPCERKIRPPLNDVSWLPAKVCIQLYKRDEQLSVKDKALLNSLKEKSINIRCASELTKEFRQLIDAKSAAGLSSWIEKVNNSGMQELKGFANGLLNDYEAVKNAITLPWSNGPVEGHINKLKTIKRQMYGRAGFNLLRKKILLGYG